jgi:hypothetical protein
VGIASQAARHHRGLSLSTPVGQVSDDPSPLLLNGTGQNIRVLILLRSNSRRGGRTNLPMPERSPRSLQFTIPTTINAVLVQSLPPAPPSCSSLLLLTILLDYDVFVPRYAYHSVRLSLASRLHLFVSTWLRQTLYLRGRSFSSRVYLFSLR